MGICMNWYKKASRSIQQHIDDVVNADLHSPIFITEKYEIIDGAHRTCKAHILGQNIEAIILSQKDIDPTLLPKDSKYVGQIYRDDQKNEYAVTELLKLYEDRKTKTINPEIILKQSADVWGKEIDIYEIIEQAKKKMNQSKKIKNSIRFPFSTNLLWKKITDNFSSVNPNPPLPKIIGTINNIKILIVNGDKIKKEKNMDFVEGGNGQAWDFIPKNEIWIDACINYKDFPHIIYHEYLEQYLMKKYNLTYDDAHEIANKYEKEKIITNLQS